MPGLAIGVDAALTGIHAKAKIALHTGWAVFVALAIRGRDLNTDAVKTRLPNLAVAV